MYIINTQFKKTRSGGKYLCRVFHISNIKSNPYDISNQVANKFDLQYKDGSIVISHGSGTGAIVLKQLLKDAVVYDISF